MMFRLHRCSICAGLGSRSHFLSWDSSRRSLTTWSDSSLVFGSFWRLTIVGRVFYINILWPHACASSYESLQEFLWVRRSDERLNYPNWEEGGNTRLASDRRGGAPDGGIWLSMLYRANMSIYTHLCSSMSCIFHVTVVWATQVKQGRFSYGRTAIVVDGRLGGITPSSSRWTHAGPPETAQQLEVTARSLSPTLNALANQVGSGVRDDASFNNLVGATE